MKKPLNICIISQEYPPFTNWGGIATYYKELSEAFCRLGHSVTIISRKSEISPDFEKPFKRLQVFRVGVPMNRKYFVGRTIDKLLHARDVYAKIISLDKIEQFDIIETPEVYLEGNFLVNNQYFRQKLSIECHGSNSVGVIPDGIFSFLHQIDYSWSYKIEKNILKKADRITTPSRIGKENLIINGIKKNIHVIYHGVDINRFKPASNRLPTKYLEVGFVGKLQNMKGLDFVWAVIKKLEYHKGIRFHLIGEIHPSEEDNFQNMIKKYKKSVEYHSFIELEKMAKMYQSLNVLLRPSRFEQFGIVYAEAMACGLIVFAGKKGGGSEIIKNNLSGFLVDPDNDIGFVVSKLKEIANDLDQFDKMKILARETAEKRFSIKASASNKIKYYYKELG